MAGSFSLDLSRLIEKANGQTEVAVRKVMMEAFRGVVLKTPVRTGRARANWTVGYNGPSNTVTDAEDKSGGATIGKIASEVQTVRVDDSMNVWLTNALPYVPKLEYGYSQQAPQGMVRLTLTEITARYGT